MTPALADANNGNWQTAHRWARLLAGHYEVRVVKAWPDDRMADNGTDLLLALHARRSADSVAAWDHLRQNPTRYRLVRVFERWYLNKNFYSWLDPMYANYFVAPRIEIYEALPYGSSDK